MPRYRITVGIIGSPARCEDRLAARPRSEERALDRGLEISRSTRTDEYVWVWRGERQQTAYGLSGESWRTIGTFHRGKPWRRDDA